LGIVRILKSVSGFPNFFLNNFEKYSFTLQKMKKIFLLKFLNSKTFHLEIRSQSIMKLSEKPLYSLKISRKNTWRISPDFWACKFRISPSTCPDFTWPQIPNPVLYKVFQALSYESVCLNWISFKIIWWIWTFFTWKALVGENKTLTFPNSF